MHQGTIEPIATGAVEASVWARAVHAIPSSDDMFPWGLITPRDLLRDRAASPDPDTLRLSDYALNLQQTEIGGFPLTVWATRLTTEGPPESGWSSERRCTWPCACGRPCATSAAAVMWYSHCCCCYKCLLEGTDRGEAMAKATAEAANFLTGAIEKGRLMVTCRAIKETITHACREQMAGRILCVRCKIIMTNEDSEQVTRLCMSRAQLEVAHRIRAEGGPPLRKCLNCYGPTLSFNDVGSTYTGQQRFCLMVASIHHRAGIVGRARDLIYESLQNGMSDSYLQTLRNEAEMFAMGHTEDAQRAFLGMLWGPDHFRAPLAAARARATHSSRLNNGPPQPPPPQR